MYDRTKMFKKPSRDISVKAHISLVGFFLSIFLIIPTSAIASTYLNLGLEGGLTVPNLNSSFGGHVSVRSSLVKVHWVGPEKSTPKEWKGGYVRAEFNPQGHRAVLGYGHSAFFMLTGLEYGLFLTRGQKEELNYGGELSLYTTLGVAALYIRESVIMYESPQWQTDIGIRLQFPNKLK